MVSSELIVMTMQALLDDDDDIIPMPDYPLWTAAANLAGGKAVHYRCLEDDHWQPDLKDKQNHITHQGVLLSLTPIIQQVRPILMKS